MRDEVKEELGIELVQNLGKEYGAVILAVAHKEFNELPLQTLIKDNHTVVFDTKSFFNLFNTSSFGHTAFSIFRQFVQL